MKMSRIKEEIAKVLMKFAAIKTNDGVLEYDGEDLVAGMNVYTTNEDGERVPANDGEYATEDGKVITIKDGKVESIVDTKAEVDEDEVAEELKEEEVVAEETAQAEGEPVKEEEPKESEPTEIEKIREEINELYKLIDGIMEKIGENRKELDERFSQFEKMSIAQPASEEFERTTTTSTGNEKIDRINKMFGK